MRLLRKHKPFGSLIQYSSRFIYTEYKYFIYNRVFTALLVELNAAQDCTMAVINKNNEALWSFMWCSVQHITSSDKEYQLLIAVNNKDSWYRMLFIDVIELPERIGRGERAKQTNIDTKPSLYLITFSLRIKKLDMKKTTIQF